MTRGRSSLPIFATLIVLVLVLFLHSAGAWRISAPPTKSRGVCSFRTAQQTAASGNRVGRLPSSLPMFFADPKTKEGTSKEVAEDPPTDEDDVERTTEKYGLEAGLFQSIKQKDGGATAQGLLKKYGIAYLATSIPLAMVSFAICYALVDAGVDVSSLLAKVGIEGTGDVGEKAGTAAIAYAAHKAASPIRFPPTVILTPFVAKLIGKEVEEDEAENTA